MKPIEEIIGKNRELFDDQEPYEGHFERFQRKLEMRMTSPRIKKSIVPYLLKAAVVTVLVTLSSLWTWDTFISPSSRRMKLGDVSPEYREVENYYVRQVNLMEDEILDLDLLNGTEEREMLQEEINNMDSVYLQLQKELKANPNDERIISAMIEHYQTKLEVMSFIVDQLQSIENENIKTEKNENVNL
jgi:hypothetical protein